MSDNKPYKAMTVVPAYGRDYQTAIRAEGAWAAGYDFKIGILGSYVNVAQVPELKAHGYTHVRLRYSKLSRYVEIPLDSGP